jgi:regulator of RNase E activity RraA
LPPRVERRSRPRGRHRIRGPGDVRRAPAREDCAGWEGILFPCGEGQESAGPTTARKTSTRAEIGYPVFARGAVPTTARGRVVEEGWNVPVQIGGVTVHPGDVLIADGSGVLFVAKSRVEEVLAAAEEIAARERAMAEAVESGMPVSRVMGGAYEAMLGGGRDGKA